MKVLTIDEYINNAPELAQGIMNALKVLIETTIPEADGGISWNVPIFKYHGILVGFSLAKKHVSFGIDCLSEEDRKQLKERGYKTGKKTIQIQFDQEVPKPEIVKLIQEQAKINEIKK